MSVAQINARDFFLGYRKVDMKPHEVLVRVLVPFTAKYTPSDLAACLLLCLVFHPWHARVGLGKGDSPIGTGRVIRRMVRIELRLCMLASQLPSEKVDVEWHLNS